MKIADSLSSSRNSGYLRLGFVALIVFLSSNVQALSYSTLAQTPLFLVKSAEPLVMLNMSNDHQLFYKAYDDWSDVNGDGVLDTTYKNSIDYYGYFDSYKCYDYNAGGYFEPKAKTTDKYCNAVSGSWSGNFLNWASMARIDALRKILYGGYRSTDTGSQTILERTYLPNDAHSFAKYYHEATAGEMAKLTPWSDAELTFCNTTYNGSDQVSEDVTDPPLIRVARGNYALWAANERWQCHWKNHSEDEGSWWYSWAGANLNNGNRFSDSGLNADYNNPDWTLRAGDGDYRVRVEACKSVALKGNETCTAYPDGNLKPTGLLQKYGDDAKIKFGLMTGSFQKNKSGGVLRKNISSLSDEINTSTNGTFKAAPADGNIIRNIDALRISGYSHNDGTYNSEDSCSWGLSSFSDGECSNWGNPQSEIYLESLRYLAGKSATSGFDADDSGYVDNLGKASSWQDPFMDPLNPGAPSKNYCAPTNIIQFNASSISYDGDEMAGTSDLYDLGTLSTWINTVGNSSGEDINGHSYFIGKATSATTTDGLCTAKLLTNFSDAEGICPEVPRLEGTFDLVGLAYYAHKDGNSIRNDIDDVATFDKAKITVNNYGVTLSPAVPKIEIPVPGSTSDVVTMLPACRNSNVGGNCAIVDFKVVQAHQEVAGVGTGKFYVNWEDSEQGGDYDQDAAGVISYSITSTQITVTTKAFGNSTPYPMGFGYVISGTTKDGFHTHSGVNGFSFVDPTGVTTCSSCQSTDAATSVTYNLGSSGVALLKDPLWYLAKWGGYKEESNPALRPTGTSAPNDIPDQDYEWDADSDGTPDNYFYSTNPSELETSLGKVFENISKQVASAASTAANSQKLSTGTSIFQATFSSEDWSGSLLKYDVDLNTGGLTLDTAWGSGGDAGAALTSSGRTIITYNPATTGSDDDGMAFVWDDMSATQKAWLNTQPDSYTGPYTGTGTVDAYGEDRLNYLRGDQSKEQKETDGIFRNRSSLLGDIIDSAPAYVGTPNYGYSDILEGAGVEKYSAFKTRVSVTTPRDSMIYMGSNDGILHGFAADDGSEKLAYIPYAATPLLTKQTSPSYDHNYLVDGSPAVGDVVFADNYWHTVLVGGLNAGGQGIYALDVTDPSDFSEANASDIVLWEITPATTGFSELGYTFARPSVVKNYNGAWVSMFGNGYGGANGHAILYVVDAETGALKSAVTVDNSGNNGLSSASPVDVNGDGIIDVVYAGDLKGNLWKFIPDDSTLGTWKSAFGTHPLFKAPADTSGWAQAITTRPDVGLHPNGLPGVMVYFGTGKYIENTDNTLDTNVQRFYGIWDVWDNGASSSYSSTYSSYSYNSPPTTPDIEVYDDPVGPDGPYGTSGTHDNLLKQCVTQGDYDQTCVSNQLGITGEHPAGWNYGVRFISDNTIPTWHWDGNKGKMGWYIDLPEAGERQVSNAILRGGRIIFVTVVPSDHPCSHGGSSWLMELDAADGSAMDVAVFDVNGDGVFDADDLKIVNDGSDTKNLTPGGIGSSSIWVSPTILADGDKEIKILSSSAGAKADSVMENPDPYTSGRKSWIQLK